MKYTKEYIEQAEAKAEDGEQATFVSETTCDATLEEDVHACQHERCRLNTHKVNDSFCGKCRSFRDGQK